MAIFRDRFPQRSAAVLVLTACAFPVFVRSILMSLRWASAWRLYMNAWDLLGAFAYTQSLALLDTLLLFACLVFSATILPAKWFRNRFAAVGCAVAFLTAVYVPLATNVALAAQIRWGIRPSLSWLGLATVYVGLVAWLCSLIRRDKRLEALLTSLATRLGVLSSLYIGVGALGVVIVIIRNVT